MVDVYGHVNANRNQTPDYQQSKLVSLVPSFGVRLWGLPSTVFYGLANMLRVSEKINRKKFLGKYKKQYLDRIKYDEYLNLDTTEENYIFHLSTLWHNDEWNKNDENVNLSRHFFISACKSLKNVFFEGGLSTTGQATNKKFENSIFSGRINVKEYIEKTKKSTLVFNTPAFWNCHGWKLGEYLAMGKAIISTPLINDLPEPLIHGKNIHFVENNEDSIKKAVEQIMRDKDYREKLQQGALSYWNKYGTPQKSLELLGIK